jgi:hypothetical protein
MFNMINRLNDFIPQEPESEDTIAGSMAPSASLRCPRRLRLPHLRARFKA